MSEQHVLVTGATGFLGRHLFRFLARQPEVRIWGVSKNGGQVGTTPVDPLDLTSATALDEWKQDKPTFSAIFHLAAVLPESFQSASARDVFYPNIQMVQNVLSLAEPGKTMVIYASGTSIYGTSSMFALSEDATVMPDNYYSLAKYVGEQVCEMEGRARGFPVVSLRISAPFGPEQRVRTVINVFLQAVLDSRDLMIYGTGMRTQDFTFVEDVVGGMWLAYCHKKSGVYNIASGQSISMKSLAETVVSLVPETSSQVVFSGKPDSQEGYRGLFSIEKARRELGYQPAVSLEAGLRACLYSRLESS